MQALPYVLPELTGLKDITQSPPHIKNVWEHTLDTLRNLDSLLDVLIRRHDQDASTGLFMGLAIMRLGRYRQKFVDHLNELVSPDRSVRPLLFLAALYHDIAKPQTRHVDDGGRTRFLNHENLGAKTISQRSEALHLSNIESKRLYAIVKHHMRPTHLARGEGDPSPRAVYRFYKDTGAAGVDICLLSLADLLATYGTTLPQERWARQIQIIRILLEAYWEHPEEKVYPPSLVTGNDLMAEFHLEPGPLIGELLEIVRESQVSNEARNREDAIEIVRSYLSTK
jgi:putative nucleotidyltransferase with HDIG domain